MSEKTKAVVDPWRVVETRFDGSNRPETETIHTRIGSDPMDALAARGFAAQEMGRFANAFPKRTFRAEPVHRGGA